MGNKKKRRKLREQQAARARMIEVALDILTGIISGIVTAVLIKLLKL